MVLRRLFRVVQILKLFQIRYLIVLVQFLTNYQAIIKFVLLSYRSALSYLVRYISLILNILFNVLFITSRDDEQNGIIAHMDLILDKNEIKGRSLKPIDTSAAAEKALKEALITGKVGALSVDPQYLFIRAPRGK